MMQRTGNNSENEASCSSGARDPCMSQPIVASHRNHGEQPKPIAKNHKLTSSDKSEEKEHHTNEPLKPQSASGASFSSVNYWHYKQTGIKSRPIKLIRHPIEHLERKIFLNYLLAFLFKLIAIASGPLIVLVVFLITVPFILVRRTIWFLLNLSCTLDAKISTDPIIDGGWNYCPLNHVEAYWFKEKLVNSAVLVITNYQKNELDIEQLRKLVRQNILSKPIFRKFLSRVVAKGLPYYKGYYWQYLGLKEEKDESPTLIKASQIACDSASIDSSLDNSVDQFSVTSITNSFGSKQPDVCIKIQSNDLDDEQIQPLCLGQHIYLDESFRETNTNQVSIKGYVYRLLRVKLNLNRPLWEIRLLPAGKKKSFLVFRCHQSLADGRSLTKILTDHLTTNCDNLNVKSCRVSLEPPQKGSAEDSREKKEFSGGGTTDLKLVKEKPSFIARISRSNGMKSAILVGPLTILLWVIWTFTRRKHNHLNRSTIDADNDGNFGDDKRFYMTYYDLTKFHQIKQMTRSTVSDVILCALSGSLREYLRKFNSVPNPPNLNISLTVDMKQQQQQQHSSGKKDYPEVNCILVNVPLPTSIEGTVPRLWKIRNTMEELRTSADPWVMWGLQQVTFSILPLAWYQWLINHVALGNSSAFVSNIQGPQNMVESWCIDLFQRAILESQQPPRVVHQEQYKREQNQNELEGKARILAQRSQRVRQESRLRLRLDSNQRASISAIYYCMQPPANDIPISFNCITYHDKLFVTTLTRSLLAEDSKIIIKLFFNQLNQLAETIAKRRSLVTIVRTPAPVEINCQPASPLLLHEPSGSKSILDKADLRMIDGGQFKKLEDVGANENSNDDNIGDIEDDDEDNELKAVAVGRSNKSHQDATIKVGSEPELNKCKMCEQTVCSCKRRRSLFNFDQYSRQPGLLSSLLTPIQLLVSKRGNQEKRFELEEPSDDGSTNECICGHLLLQELDREEGQNNNDLNQGQDPDQDKEVSSVGSIAHSDDFCDTKQRTIGSESCNKCRKAIKQFSLSLSASNVGTNKRSKIWSTSKLSNRNKTTTNSNSSISNKNSKSRTSHCSAQLIVPSNQTNKFQSRLHSKSETDLIPVDGSTTTATSKSIQQSVSKESWYNIKKISVFSKPTSHQQQRKVPSSRASYNQLATSSAKNIFDFRGVDLPSDNSTNRKLSSKRRQSVATTTGAPHNHRSVVVKDEINADVSLRYQLDGPPLFGLRTRRFSTIGSGRAGKQRRSSLIPFGLIQNQNLPKLYMDYDKDDAKKCAVGRDNEAHV